MSEQEQVDQTEETPTEEPEVSAKDFNRDFPDDDAYERYADLEEDEEPEEETAEEEVEAEEADKKKPEEGESAEKPAKEEAKEVAKEADSVKELVRGAHEKFREASQMQETAIGIIQEVFKNPLKAYELPSAKHLGYTREAAIKHAEELIREVIAEEKMSPVEREALRAKRDYESRAEKERTDAEMRQREAQDQARLQYYEALEKDVSARLQAAGITPTDTLMEMLGAQFAEAEKTGYQLPPEVAVKQAVSDLEKAFLSRMEKMSDAELKAFIPKSVYKKLKYSDLKTEATDKKHNPQADIKSLAEHYKNNYRWDANRNRVVKIK